jgi:hypothetical protein
VTAWLDAVAHMQGVPRFWRFKHVHLTSKLLQLADDAVRQRGLCPSRSIAIRAPTSRGLKAASTAISSM